MSYCYKYLFCHSRYNSLMLLLYWTPSIKTWLAKNSMSLTTPSLSISQNGRVEPIKSVLNHLISCNFIYIFLSWIWPKHFIKLVSMMSIGSIVSLTDTYNIRIWCSLNVICVCLLASATTIYVTHFRWQRHTKTCDYLYSRLFRRRWYNCVIIYQFILPLNWDSRLASNHSSFFFPLKKWTVTTHSWTPTYRIHSWCSIIRFGFGHWF